MSAKVYTYFGCVFLKIRKEVTAKSGKMCLNNVCPDVMQVFKMTKLDNIFEIVE